MQVILFENVDRLGMQGDVVNVADGYYRNFLGPRGKAINASAANLKRLEAKRRKLKEEAEKQVQAAEAFGAQLSKAKLEFVRKSSDGDRLFGSVTQQEVFEALVALGFTLERRQLTMEPIKTIGAHPVKIKLIGHVEGHVTVVVKAEEEAPAKEAKADKKAEAPAETPEAPAE